MRLSTIIALFAAFFAQKTFSLEKTQEEAHKFLIDGGQVTATSEVQSFTLDRNGNVRVRIVEGDFVFNFGLEEDQDTYSIVYMNKKKQPATTTNTNTNTNTATPKTATTATNQNDELARKIGEKLSVLKGGKVVKVTKSTTNKGEQVVEYKLGTKTYTVTGRENTKTGEFSVFKVEDGIPKIVTNEL